MEREGVLQGHQVVVVDHDKRPAHDTARDHRCAACLGSTLMWRCWR